MTISTGINLAASAIKAGDNPSVKARYVIANDDFLREDNNRWYLIDGLEFIGTGIIDVNIGVNDYRSIYINDIEEYVKGVYTLEVYTEKGPLGRAECMLR